MFISWYRSDGRDNRVKEGVLYRQLIEHVISHWLTNSTEKNNLFIPLYRSFFFFINE